MALVWHALALTIAATPTAAQLTDLDATEKSLFFAGRCMAPILLREAVSTKDLRQLPPPRAVAHLYGQQGTAWEGSDDRLILVDLEVGAACGVNVFDEDESEVAFFLDYWLTREDSPFTFTDRTETEDRVTFAYDGFCEECGFNVHARAVWLREAEFTIYRIYATTPERTDG
ncbi:MAG: hypothetical protein ACU0DW_08785 [Shimia sp.]